MLLAIDVGNTNTVLGVSDAGRLRDSFRVQTEKDRTGDEYGLQIKSLFDFAGLRISDVHDVIVSSVVPPMVFPLEQMSKRFFGRKPLFVGPGVKTGMPVLYDNPREVGADGIGARMKDELGFPVKVVATGGLAPLIGSVSRQIEVVDDQLTLDGLRIIYQRNAGER